MSVWAVIKFWWSVLSLHSSSFTAVPSVWEGHGGMVLKRMCGDWRGRVNPGSPTDTIERGRVNPGSPTDTIERGKWSDVSWSRSTSWMKISYWKPSRIWRDYLLTDWFTTTFSGVSLVYWDDTIGVLSVNPPCVCVCVGAVSRTTLSLMVTEAAEQQSMQLNICIKSLLTNFLRVM